VPILWNLRADGFCRRKYGASLSYRMVGQWELAMSELKQQSIALWILLMLLILVPWALE
jgi:hypothetical protein